MEGTGRKKGPEQRLDMEGTGKKMGAKNSDWTWKEQVRRRGPRTATGHGRNR